MPSNSRPMTPSPPTTAAAAAIVDPNPTTVADAPAPDTITEHGDTIMGGTGGAAMDVPEAAAADTIPTQPMVNGDTVRHYLNSKVSGAVIMGLKKIAKEQPQDPIRVLGEYLIQLADTYETRRS